jgi:hypothetical protein
MFFKLIFMYQNHKKKKGFELRNFHINLPNSKFSFFQNLIVPKIEQKAIFHLHTFPLCHLAYLLQ